MMLTEGCLVFELDLVVSTQPYEDAGDSSMCLCRLFVMLSGHFHNKMQDLSSQNPQWGQRHKTIVYLIICVASLPNRSFCIA